MYVKITVANLGVNPGYVKIYCHKKRSIKRNCETQHKLIKRIVTRSEEKTKCVKQYGRTASGHTYPLPGLTIKSHKSSACQGRSRIAVASHSVFTM